MWIIFKDLLNEKIGTQSYLCNLIPLLSCTTQKIQGLIVRTFIYKARQLNVVFQRQLCFRTSVTAP